MNKRIMQLLTAVTTLAVVFSISVCATEVTEENVTTAVPLTLSAAAYGTDPVGIVFSVTVPTSLPMSLNTDGTVTTADDCSIINNSHGPVEIKSITISTDNGWSLTNYDGAQIFSADNVDSRILGFSIALGDGPEYCTDASDSQAQQVLSESDNSCRMTSVDDETGNTLSIHYHAVVSPTSSALTDETIADVAFVIGWAE